MIFYNFFTDRYRSPGSLVYRTNDKTDVVLNEQNEPETIDVPQWSEFQTDIKYFTTNEEAQKDFMAILWDNPDFRTGEIFDTDKKKKSTKPIIVEIAGGKQEVPDYNILPSDFKLELNKVYNLDCLLFMRQMPDKYLDYIFTSPPYNIKKQIGTDDLYKVYGDDLTPEEYLEWLSDIIDEGMRVTKKHFFMNIQMLGKNKTTVLQIMGKYRNIIKDIIIWNKKIAAPHIQPGVMNSKFEFIFIFSNDRPHLKVFSDAQWSQGTFNNVLDGMNASRNQHSDLNKATFPLYLPRTIMQKFGKKGDIWYDPFNGTGTTAHAAAMEERQWVATEIDIEQCAVTDKRVENEENALKFEFGDRTIGKEYNFEEAVNNLNITNMKLEFRDLTQEEIDEIENEERKEMESNEEYNPPPFKEGHNPFGKGGVYTPGDPGL